jgi:hypothetical protein
MTRLNIIVLIFYLLVVGACKKECDRLPTGVVIGFVKLYSDNDPDLSDFSGVLATLENTNISSTTDATGKFTFEGVSPGTYDITLTKPGFGTVKYFSFSYSGGPAPGLIPSNIIGLPYFALSAFPTYTITSLALGLNMGFLEVSGNTSVDRANLICVYSGRNDVSNTNYEGLLYIEAENNSFLFSLPNNFPKGTKLYFKAYPVSRGFYSFYRDRDSNMVVVTSIGSPTNTIDFTIP